MDSLSQTGIYGYHSCVGIWKKKFQIEERTSTNALRQECTWLVQGPARRPLWLEPGEQGKQLKKEKKLKHFIRDLEGHGKNLDI